MSKVRFKGHAVLSVFNSSRIKGAMRWPTGEVRELDQVDAFQLLNDFPLMFEMVTQTTAAAKPPVDRSVKSPVKKVTKKPAATKKPPAKKKAKK